MPVLFILICFVGFGYGNVIGIDFGSEYFKVSYIGPDKVFQIIENEYSQRSTPNVIAFLEGKRLFGRNAAAYETKFQNKTISFIPTLLGGTQIVQRDGEGFSAIEINGMAFEYIKSLSNATDCAITVPSNWNYSQRTALIHSAKLADLNVMSLVNENTAAAVFYAWDKQSSDKEYILMLYNVGSRHTQVTIAQYTTYRKTAAVAILASVSYEFGGWDIDIRLADELAKMVYNKTGVDLRHSSKDVTKLRKHANYVKKMLSASKEVRLEVDDLNGVGELDLVVNRETLEKCLDRTHKYFTDPVYEVLKAANLKLTDLTSIELIGGVSRIPWIHDLLSKKLGVTPTSHLNRDEAMAHGAAIIAANYSSTIGKMKPIWVSDILSAGIKVKINQGFSKEISFQKGEYLGLEYSEEVKSDSPVYVDIVYSKTGGTASYQIDKGPSNTKLSLYFKLNSSGIVDIELYYATPELAKRPVIQINGINSEQMDTMKTRLGNIKKQEIQRENHLKARNELEGYIYYLKDKLTDIATESERQKLANYLTEKETLINSPEFHAFTIQKILSEQIQLETYFSTLSIKENDNKTRSPPPPSKEKDNKTGSPIVSQALAQLAKYETQLRSMVKYLTIEEMTSMYSRIKDEETWIQTMSYIQHDRPNWELPLFTSQNIKSRFNSIELEFRKLAKMTSRRGLFRHRRDPLRVLSDLEAKRKGFIQD